MEANNVEKRFNDWFTVSYDRLRNLVGRYGALDEDNFHDTYLFVRKQVLNPEREITDYEAYFIGCYRKAFMVLNSCEKLVKDILNFIRRKFSYQEYRMFTLRFYESDFSFKALGECMGISASAISGKVNTIMDAVRSNRGFSWRSQMLAVEGFIS